MTPLLPLDASGQPSRAVVVGVVNCTPDSFFDGGAHTDLVAHAATLLDEGADWLDVGGESTRPGAVDVDADAEWARVRPVVEAFARDAVVCIDTSKPSVAARALAAGARVVNDVTGLRHPEMPAVTADADATVVMHMRGTPRTMRDLTDYDDLVTDIVAWLDAAAARSRSALTLVDPGIGFAKTAAQSLALLAATDRLVATGRPVYIGASRKSFIGRALGLPDAGDRLAGSLGAVAAAYARGARVFRVHDVRPTRHLVDLMAAVDAAGPRLAGTGPTP